MKLRKAIAIKYTKRHMLLKFSFNFLNCSLRAIFTKFIHHNLKTDTSGLRVFLLNVIAF